MTCSTMLERERPFVSYKYIMIYIEAVCEGVSMSDAVSEAASNDRSATTLVVA